MSMYGHGDKPPSKFVVNINDKSILGPAEPKSKRKGDERVWIYAGLSNDTSKIRKVVVRRAEVEILHAQRVKKAGTDEADASGPFIAKPGRPKAIERLPAFGFRSSFAGG